MKGKLKQLAFTAAIAFSTALTTTTAYADQTSGITDPLKNNGATVTSVTSNGITYIVDAVEAISGGWFLFHLYRAIMLYAGNSRNAQKREEAKSHLIHVGVSGVFLGGAIAFASALVNFGSQLGGH